MGICYYLYYKYKYSNQSKWKKPMSSHWEVTRGCNQSGGHLDGGLMGLSLSEGFCFLRVIVGESEVWGRWKGF